MRTRLARWAPLAALIASLLVGPVIVRAQTQGYALTLFEQYLESLRQQTGIPGLSAAIIGNGRIIWERGFGLENVERGAAASPDTPYHVADLTEVFVATLLLQCVDRGTLALDDAVAPYSGIVPEPGATVRQVLAHVTQGTPGARYRYDPSRFESLPAVIDACLDQPYRQAVAFEILDRLGMQDSVPGQDLDDPDPVTRDLFDGDALRRYASVIGRLAPPYRTDRRDHPTLSDYPPRTLGASLGLISTVRDLARFDAALDDGALLNGETQAAAWTNYPLREGGAAPMGAGWFVQFYRGERIIWHFGLRSDAYSSLYVKVPARGRTLILLANSGGLNASFDLPDGDVTSSPFARLFLQLFV